LLNVGYAAWLYRARRYDESIAQAHRALELDPTNAAAYRHSGWSRYWQGDIAGAIADFSKAVSFEPEPRMRANLAYAYASSGQRAKAEEILRELETLSTQRYVSPGARAITYLGLGDRAKALDWLERAYEEQDGACWFLKVDPVYDVLRSEPRFQALLRKVGLEK
jgi:adenylate cyclase